MILRERCKEISLSLQLIYGEDDKATRKCSNQKKINGGTHTHDIYPTNDGDHIISPQKVLSL